MRYFILIRDYGLTDWFGENYSIERRLPTASMTIGMATKLVAALRYADCHGDTVGACDYRLVPV